jgi:hypothetical protein
MRSHHEASVLTEPVILDRGVPDVLGYLTVCGLPVPEHGLLKRVTAALNSGLFRLLS